MARFLKNREKSKGQSPGSLVFIGRKKVEITGINCITYSNEMIQEHEISDVGEIKKCLRDDKVTWINLYGLQDVSVIEKIGKIFEIDPLALEDILNTDERPKLIEYKNQMVIILKTLFISEVEQKIKGDQVSIVLGKNYVITFQEVPANIFGHLRERLRSNRGITRGAGSDFLAYALIDTLVDNYIINIEKIGLEIESREEDIIRNKNRDIVEEIYRLKSDVSFIRKSIRPSKEITVNLLKTSSRLFQPGTNAYIADLDDHLTQAIEATDLYLALANDLMNMYHTNLSNRANEVMKVLTIFASIFIPLTFIVGVYGTNFDNLPELHFKYGYFGMWGFMTLLTGIMLYYFKRKGWW